MNRDILSKIEQEQMISREELEELLTTTDQELIEELYRRARATAGKYYGKEIYLRGLIEFTNYCKNNCYYCGIRCGNEKAQRYRLTMDQILSCCESGWELGFRTFVLQGGEDPYYTDERICTIIKEIKKRYPDCAVEENKKPEVDLSFFAAVISFQSQFSWLVPTRRIRN